MAIAPELSARLAEILNSHEVPVIVIEKLREIKAAEVADFAGLASRAKDLGDFPQMSKLEDSALVCNPKVTNPFCRPMRPCKSKRRYVESGASVRLLRYHPNPPPFVRNNPTVIYTT